MKAPGFIFFLLLYVSVSAGAQNLFPNGGFEQFNQCPTYTSQIERCTDLDSCLGTADFYHCNYYGYSTIGNYGIPATGSGVIGFAASVPGSWSPPGRFYGETFSCPLKNTLEPGATYSISADLLYNTVQWPPPGPCLQLGFYFYKSNNPPLVPPGSVNYNPYRPHVGINANLIPVGSYGTFTFSFVADSCYDRVMIGVFSNDSTFGTTCYNSGSGTFYFDMDNIAMIRSAGPPLRVTTAVSDVQATCVDGCINYAANSNLTVYTWNWIFNGALTTTSQLQNPQSICYPQGGDYDVTLITTYECSADTIKLEKYIHVDELPEVEISFDSSTNCFGEPLQLTAEGNGTISWSTGEIADKITVTGSGDYIAYSTGSCGMESDTASVFFENCNCTVYLPNAFTPDEDGNNDQFKAEGECVLKDFKLQVFDRWGKQLFKTDDITAAWDGRYNGEACPQGIYAVTLTWSGYSDYKVKKVSKSGYLALIR